MRSLVLLTLLLLGWGCSTPPDVHEIIDRTAQLYGYEPYQHAKIDFDLRGKHFTLWRDNGYFQYERHYADSVGAIKEVLNNHGFFRFRDEVRMNLPDTTMAKYESSVNSTAYFALLPFPLKDPAVIKEYLGQVEYEGGNYHKVEIRFQEEGGGRDFQDWFVYWIDVDTYEMDYLSYYYFTDEEGSRFRHAKNVRVIEGIRFQDYDNYRSDAVGRAVERYDEEEATPDIVLVSEILLENVSVERLTPGTFTPYAPE